MISGIICEYNPFHKGHKYHIDRTKEQSDGGIIAVMSGNFVQRGEPALLDKSIRAGSAVCGGVDLVFELPLPWSIASAQEFASGGIYLLDKTGIVNRVSFGSESGDSEKIMHTAKIVLRDDVRDEIKAELDKGISYPSARYNAVKKLCGENYADVLNESNDILGTEYCKAIIKSGSEITPFAVKRTGGLHNSDEETDGYLSALSIRNKVKNNENIGDFIPDFARFHYDDVHNFKLLERSVLGVLRKMSVDDFKNIPDVSEGLEYRIVQSVKKSCGIDELYENIKTKRYTLSRIRRIILCAYLGIDDSFIKKQPPYLRVLAFNDRGRELIKEIKKKSGLPVVMGYSDIKKLDEFSQAVFEIESRSTDLFNLCSDKIGECGAENKRIPEIIVGKG